MGESKMAKNAAQIMIDRLADWGVETIFGLPGDGINGLMEALRVRQEKIRFVQVRHEEAAAFMACAHAKFTGKLGVCLATSGPGAIHLLNGLYDAKMDGAAVLALTGQTYHDLMGTHYQQEVDLISLFKDVAVFNQMVTGAVQVRALVDAGCRAALAEQGVAHINFPVDLQEQTCDEDQPSSSKVHGHTSSLWTSPTRIPTQDQIGLAADLLNHGQKTVILSGRGALGAGEELEVLADRLGAPIVKALLGKAVVPDDSPYTTGGLGLLGTRPSEMAMEECDTLLMVGTQFPYLNYFPEPGQARTVQIDRDPRRIGLRTPVEVGLAGDAKATLRALLPLLRRREDRSFLEFAQFRMKEWQELIEDRATRLDVPLKPQVIAGRLNDYLTDDAIVATDSGTITTWAARHIRMRRGMMFSCSGLLATMAPGAAVCHCRATRLPATAMRRVRG
ncbi:MAG TPA: thiamine pyrophosphate-binding protein [Polyangium sp.]|nr:thiamine pyrophosphate-binding protein [Polyangium sp.]